MAFDGRRGTAAVAVSSFVMVPMTVSLSLEFGSGVPSTGSDPFAERLEKPAKVSGAWLPRKRASVFGLRRLWRNSPQERRHIEVISNRRSRGGAQRRPRGPRRDIVG